MQGPPQEIAAGVFVIPDRRIPLVPNIGIILGDRAALVVDTGLGPRSGHVARQLAKEVAGDRPLLVTLTHFHPEHGFGAQAFTGATLVYNRAQRDEFREKRAGYLEQFRGLGAAVAEELQDVGFVDPEVVYDPSAEIDLGGRVVELQARGAAHSRGDQTIFLPAERILFTGDLVETRFFPIFPFFPPYDVDVDGDHWLDVLADLRALEPAHVVPGHGALGGVELIDAYRTCIELLKSETLRLAATGQDADAITAALIATLAEQFPDWDTSEPWRITSAVQLFLTGAR